MASHLSIKTRQDDDGDFLPSLVQGERGQALRAQLGARYPDCSADTIDDAIQFACGCFLDEAEGITAPGQVYAWIRTAAHRALGREADRRHREVAVDPVEEGMDRLAAEETDPVEELTGLEDDADLAVLVEKVTSSLTDRQRDVFALYGAGYKRPQIADRLGLPERDVKEQLRLIMDKARAVLAGLAGGLWSARDEPVDALRDLVQLWWWRDLRFAVSPLHLADSDKPLTESRMRAREDAVRELGRDYLERGGLESVIADELSVEDEPCALHSIPRARLSSASETVGKRRLPRGDRDRELVEAAYDAGAHVFLTADKGILKCHSSLFEKGLAIMNPTQLLEVLDDSGELDGTRGGDFLLPDISTLSRLYAGFSDS